MQLELCFLPQTRFEIPPSRTTWRDGDQTVVQEVGAHSVDLNWSFLVSGEMGHR
jgi:hypothetical protein